MSKEDVYETEDYSSPEISNVEENFDNPDIETIHVDIDSAIKRFGNRLLNADDVDFSDSLNKKRRGYRSGNYVLEIVGSENKDNETIEQKIERLRFELEELTLLIEKKNKKNENGENSVISKNELDSLNNILQAAILENKECSTSTFLNEKNDNFDLIKFQNTKVDSAEWRNLDERIKKIEQAVIGNVKNRTHYEPLTETIDNLRLQVECLNPGYLEATKNQLSSAITKLAEFDDKRKKLSIDDYEEKINELYKLVTKWDATCVNIPAIVKRLQSLSKLHEQAQEFSSRLNDVLLVKQHLNKKNENHKVMLFELKKESAQVIDELLTKITKLEKKIAT